MHSPNHVQIPIPETCRERARELLKAGTVQRDTVLQFKHGSTYLRGTAEQFASRFFTEAKVDLVPSVRVSPWR